MNTTGQMLTNSRVAVVGVARAGIGQVKHRGRSAWDRVRRNPRSSVATGLVAVTALGLIVAMVLADGFRATSYDLKPAGVWVMNKDAKRFGRVNARLSEQDGLGDAAVVASGILQDGRDVFVATGDGGELRRVSAATLDVEGDSVRLASGSTPAIGGGRFAVVDAAGDVRVANTADAASLSADDPAGKGGPGGDGSGADSPTTTGKDSKGKDSKGAGKKGASKKNSGKSGLALSAGAGARAAVGRHGDVVVASPSRKRLSVLRPGVAAPETVEAAFAADGDVQVSVAGRKPVALQGSTLVLPDGMTTKVSGANPRLQLPSDDADHVVVATDAGILSFPIDGGAPRTLSTSTVTPAAARPVNIGGCTYAAWGGEKPKVLYVCGAQQLERDLPSGVEVTAQTELTWQVNGDYAVLNDMKTGFVVVVANGKVIKADQWDTTEVTGTGQSTTNSRTPDPNFVATDNKPPEAADDSFGARAGLPSILPVLDNDKDPNGDVLAVRGVSQVPDGTTVQIVRGGTAVQITPAGNLGAGATLTFDYVVSDGWSNTAASCPPCSATVTVRLADPRTNQPPELKAERPPAHITVAPKARVTYPVLDDWIDPDGDPVVLNGAAIDPTVADVSAQTDGLLTYVDRSGAPGEHAVAVTVSDQPLSSLPPKSQSGTVAVTVAGVNSPPVARGDYASTKPGLPVVVWPLLNDTDPDGDDLSFTLVPAGGVPPSVHQNADGSVTVTPTDVGSVQFGYALSDGHNAPEVARIRVDVVAPTTDPPSAGLDLVVLPAPPASGARSSRTVDLLLNDVSPSGNVLVVTRVKPRGDNDLGVETQLIDHRRLAVSYQGRLSVPALLEYTLSDGNTTTTGLVVVVSAESDANLPPVAVDDAVDVRVGDVVSVPVVMNDVDPEGADLYLRSAERTRGDGIAFVSGQRVRFLAPDQPGTTTITYTIGDDPKDGSGNEATGRLTVTIRNSSANSAPIPPPVDARVVAGSSVRITVPLAGIDPDGDSVTLLGLGLEGNRPQAPKLGRITHIGLDTFTYEAFGTPGTDVFRYRVVDTGGPAGQPLEAEGVIRVGVAPSDGQNSAPEPRSDQFTLRPGIAHLDVLANDFDPDGDPITLTSVQGPDSLAAKVDSGRVVLTLPSVDQPTPFALSYAVADRAGLSTTATVTVTVDPNAKGMPPIARDDLAEPGADPKASRMSVNVLENDDDPDGDPAKLTAKVADGTKGDASFDGDQRMSVAVAPRTQVIAYQITDEQDLTATAIVRVPPSGTETDLPPALLPDARAVSKGTTTGETVEIKIDKVAADPEGKPIRLDGSNPTAVNGTVEVVDATTFKFTPDPYDVRTGTGPRGPAAASVSFIVTDGAEGQVGQRAVLTLPVDVELDAPALPAWKAVSPLTVSVYQHDDPAKVDLRLAAEDPDTDASKLTFAITPDSPAVNGVKVEMVDEHILTASVSGTAPAPNLDLGYVEVQVTDDKGQTALKPARVPVRTVATSRPLPALATFDTEAESGKPTTVDILQGATSPFDEAITDAVKLVAGSVQTKSGKGQAAPSGDHQVVFTPSADAESVGTASVSFEVVDIVGRKVPGAVTFTVSSVPSAPGAPTVRQVSATSVEVAWAAADKHGKEIQEYVVTDNQQHSTSCGTQLFCLIQGLTPGTTYTYTVVAKNERGTGPASPASPSIRPDECPAAPTNVQLTFDVRTNPKTGQQLVASWEKPANNGTAIEGYEVRVDPPSATPNTELVRGTTTTLTGLTNGLPHKVTVRAKNQCDGGGLGVAAQSNTEIPAGLPDAPTMISATDAADPTGGRIELTWMPPKETGTPSDHGDRVSLYTITAVDGASGFGTAGVQTYQPTGLRKNANGSVTANLSVNRNLDSYRFTVAATNKAGIGPASAASAPQTARGKPAAPQLVSATFDPDATTNDAQVTVTYRESTDAGDDKISYLYRVNGGAWTEVPDNVHTFGGTQPHRFTLTGLLYGTKYTYELKAKNDSYETAAPASAASTSLKGGGASKVYGMFGAPSISGCSTANLTVTCNWSAGAARGNTVTLQLRGDPFNYDTTTSTGDSRNYPNGGSGTQSISAVDSTGRSLAGNSVPWNIPAPQVTMVRGPRAPDGSECIYGDAQRSGDTRPNCYYLTISLSNFPAGGHTVRCYMTMNSGTPAVYKTISMGNGTVNDCSFSSGGRWVWVVVDGEVYGGYVGLAQYEWARQNHSGYISDQSDTPGWPGN